MAIESVREGVEGVIVDGDDVNGGGKVVIAAALASQNCYFETSFQDLFENGWAEVARGLRCKFLVLVKLRLLDGI